MSYFDVVKYNDWLYQIKDPKGVLSTLIIGDKKALVIDTCYGIGDLKEEIKKITNKKLIVVNSHGHMDHASGNYQFDEVWIHEEDVELCKQHNSKEMKIKNINLEKDKLPEDFNYELYCNQREGNLKIISMPMNIDLGERIIELIHIPGHTHGSIAFYDALDKLMVTSDGACPFTWLFLDESTSVSIYIDSLKKILSYDFDNFLVGHGAKLLPRSRMVEFLQTALELDLEKSVKVNFGENAYCYTKYQMFDQNGAGIVFDPRKLK